MRNVRTRFMVRARVSRVSLCVFSLLFVTNFYFVISTVLEQKLILGKSLEIPASGEGSGGALQRDLDNFASR